MNTYNFDNFNPKCIKDLQILLKDDQLRLEVYRHMKESLKKREYSGYSAGMCHCVPDFIKYTNEDRISVRLKVLPELWAYKPKIQREDGYWFNEVDFEIRIAILEEIINKMSK